jgi:NAD(P)-dependent dehydrogenase (short-subunit alcohol dehydrogenase family)
VTGNQSLKLAGLRALVTGAGTGIGRAIAEILGAAGSDLMLHYRSHEQGVQDLATRIRTSGRSVAIAQGDLADEGAATNLARRTLSELGGLDILVCSAGWTLERLLAKTTDAELDRLIAGNLRAPIVLVRELLPALAQSQAPSILFVSSIHAVRGFPGYSVYAATKGGLESVVYSLAVELGPQGIRVNAISPGLVEVQRVLSDPGYDATGSARKIPLGRAGQPGDIARLASFVVSPEASWLTGEVIRLDGGTSALMALTGPRPGPNL